MPLLLSCFKSILHPVLPSPVKVFMAPLVTLILSCVETSEFLCKPKLIIVEPELTQSCTEIKAVLLVGQVLLSESGSSWLKFALLNSLQFMKNKSPDLNSGEQNLYRTVTILHYQYKKIFFLSLSRLSL